jgi:hypothetical protein
MPRSPPHTTNTPGLTLAALRSVEAAAIRMLRGAALPHPDNTHWLEVVGGRRGEAYDKADGVRETFLGNPFSEQIADIIDELCGQHDVLTNRINHG